jgi:hypothetical protein
MLALLALPPAACASAPSPAPCPDLSHQGRGPAAAAIPGEPSRAGSLRLGHYSTGDGLVGFVLDRTGAKPRVRIDGEDRVYELDVVATSPFHTDLVSHERHIGISFLTDGSGISFSGKARGEQPVWRDGDAAPLPPQ